MASSGDALVLFDFVDDDDDDSNSDDEQQPRERFVAKKYDLLRVRRRVLTLNSQFVLISLNQVVEVQGEWLSVLDRANRDGAADDFLWLLLHCHSLLFA